MADGHNCNRHGGYPGVDGGGDFGFYISGLCRKSSTNPSALRRFPNSQPDSILPVSDLDFGVKMPNAMPPNNEIELGARFREDAMSSWLLATLLALMPSVAAVLWLIWHSDALKDSNFEMISEDEDQFQKRGVR